MHPISEKKDVILTKEKQSDIIMLNPICVIPNVMLYIEHKQDYTKEKPPVFFKLISYGGGVYGKPNILTLNIGKWICFKEAQQNRDSIPNHLEMQFNGVHPEKLEFTVQAFCATDEEVENYCPNTI